MQQHGYDCYMIFVNTSLEVAMERNRKRARKIPDDLLKQMWNSCQNNIGHFQNIFGNNFRIVDRTTSEPINRSVIKNTVEFLKSPIKNPIGKKWIQSYYDDNKKVNQTVSGDFELDDAPLFEPIRPRGLK